MQARTFVHTLFQQMQLWMTIKKTEISAQHEFLKPIYLCLCRGMVLICLDIYQTIRRVTGVFKNTVSGGYGRMDSYISVYFLR